VTTWSVLCPGPSLRLWNYSNFEVDGPVIAINSAILAPLAVDIWSCVDGPKKLKRYVEGWSAKRRREMIVWSYSEGRSEAWGDLGFPCNVWSPREISKTVVVTLMRLAWIGVESVRLYGCDMEGEGYSYGEDLTLPICRTGDRWGDRWPRERMLVDRQVGRMLAANIQVAYRSHPC
jgi:hypothetical protein